MANEADSDSKLLFKTQSDLRMSLFISSCDNKDFESCQKKNPKL